MRTILASLVFTALATIAEGADVEILSHDLTVVIDPKTSSIVSTDKLRVRGPGTIEIPEFAGIDVQPSRRIEVAEGEHDITVRFSGIVENAVEKSNAATWVAGDSTLGTIGTQGSYLVRGYYVPSAKPAKFRATVSVPLPHRAVMPGRRTAESEKDGVYSVTCESSYGLDGFVIVTGPWTVTTEVIDGVSCRTFLRDQNKSLAPMLMASLREEIPRYQKLLGPVPDGRFDIVSNFFSTGYGFSNFTLLGEQVISYVCAKAAREGRKTLPSGYIDHELVHCWIGNYLHVNYEKGNWCEALTTWFTNYGTSVREKRDREYRRKVSRRFSLRVSGERDYPLRNFRSKQEDFENDIGYGKGSMIFHMLERKIGREKLIHAVRHTISTQGGKTLGWSDLIAALSEGAKTDLAPWFAPWLDRKGAPILRFGTVHTEGNVITGTIVQTQDGPAFALRVPIQVEGTDGNEEHLVSIAAKETAFRITARQQPIQLVLDPDHHVFRKLARADVAPCLEAVLTAPKRVGAGDAGLLKRLDISEGAAALPKDAAVLLFGVPKELRPTVFAAAARQAAGFQVSGKGFAMKGVRYDEPGDGILMTYRRSGAPPVAFFHGNADAAFTRPKRYLPYYASHGWVVFREGRPVARGEFDGDPGARRRTGAGRVDSIVADLLNITDAKWQGRRGGAPLAYKLANELRGRLFQTGASILPWPGVQIPTGEMKVKPWIQIGETKHDGGLFAFHWTGDAPEGVPCEGIAVHPAKTVDKALVIMAETATYEEMAEVAEQGAAAIVVIAADDTMKKRGRQSTWHNSVPPSVSLAGRNMQTAIAGLMSRTSDNKALSIPVLYAAKSMEKVLADVNGEIRIGLSIRRSETATSNLVGVFGPPKKRGILLSAHWDGLGMVDGQPAQGAADNAAGVAVVLWVATQLKMDADAGRLKLPVVVALFGAEESGLIGSRQFVRALEHPICPVAKPLQVLNVDAIGGGKNRTVYVIGRSHYPKLFDLVKPQLEKNGLVIGRDLDKFAFAGGSDHWSFHQGGIPAITLFGTDYRSMNTLADTVDRVDVGMLREVAKSVYRSIREMTRETKK